MLMDAAKSGQPNAQTHLSRLQEDEFRVKQVCNNESDFSIRLSLSTVVLNSRD